MVLMMMQQSGNKLVGVYYFLGGMIAVILSLVVPGVLYRSQQALSDYKTKKQLITVR